MAIAKDYSGQIYGRLKAIRMEGDKGGKWLFSCECGASCVASIAHVRSGHTKSCGCIALERLKERSITHGHSLGRQVSPTFSSYRSAYARCFRPSAKAYPRYGAIGITMCRRWADSFENFLADMGERPEGTTLDRYPDPLGNYEPGNCRWATNREQSVNRKSSILVDHEGDKICLKDFASIMEVPYLALHARVVYRNQNPYSAAEAMRLRANKPS